MRARAVESVSLNQDQVESGKIIICAAAANAAIENSPQADDILTSCLLAVKATERAAATPAAASPQPTAPGTPAPSGNGQGLASFNSRVAKQAFAGLEKNYKVSRDQFARMVQSPDAASSITTMLQSNLSPDQFAKAQAVIARAEAAAAAEKQKEEANNVYNLGAPIRNNDISSLRAALKERMDKIGGNRKRNGGLRRLPPRVAANQAPAPRKLSDEQLTPAEESLFTQPATAAAPEEPMVELTLFDVVSRKYREKFEMMASPMLTGPIHAPGKPQ